MISRSDSWAFMIVNIAARAMDLINKSNDRVHSSARPRLYPAEADSPGLPELLDFGCQDQQAPARLSLIMCRLQSTSVGMTDPRSGRPRRRPSGPAPRVKHW
jgi:hypothetical protein